MNPQQILRDSWFFYSRNILQIALLCGPLLLLEAISAHLWEQSQGSKLVLGQGLLLGLLFSPLYQGVLIFFLASRSGGASASAGQLFTATLRVWPALALLTGLGMLIKGLGMLMLILPGLWIAVKLIFADYLVVLRQQHPIDAMRESFRLTTGHFWNIVLLMIVAWAPVVMAAMILLNPDMGLGDDSMIGVMLAIPIGLAQLFSTVVLFRYFMLIEAADKPA